MSFVHTEWETGCENNVLVSPLWLLLLEHVLGHGVPVMLCGERCTGLLAIADFQSS